MAAPPSPSMMVLDYSVTVVDGVAALIKENGGPLYLVNYRLPAWLNRNQREEIEQRATRQGLLQYHLDVEAPTDAILRERKDANPSAVRKLVAIGGKEGDRYRAVLEGIEPDLSGFAHPPVVTTLALRVSAEGRRAVNRGAFVAAADHNIIAMYVNPYRPLFHPTGFYLIYDFFGNSLAAVPPLPPAANYNSHRNAGAGALVIRHNPPSDYVLAELLLDRHSNDKATVFLWWSSGPDAGQWINKEVHLPFPLLSDPEYTFRSDTTFALGNSSGCWVDLFFGVLLCRRILKIPEFQFIPLPEGHSKLWNPAQGRGSPIDTRSMCCVNGDAMKFVDIDNDIIEIFVWHQSNQQWNFVSACWTTNIFADPMFRSSNLPHISPKLPVLSSDEDSIIYVFVDVDKKRYGISLLVERAECLSIREIPQGVRISDYMMAVDIR